MRLYFAYGANINLETMKFRCPDAKVLSKAIAENKEFIINQFGVASIVDRAESSVHGILWEISESDEANLDIFEGVDYNFYLKELISIFSDGKKIENVLVYLATNEKENPVEERSDYLSKIIAWASIHKFPSSYISRLKNK
jgi:gamma-glutamylcyclotransferase (GGCT)/AIG2-like uncharacterized protein YtfP